MRQASDTLAGRRARLAPTSPSVIGRTSPPGDETFSSHQALATRRPSQRSPAAIPKHPNLDSDEPAMGLLSVMILARFTLLAAIAAMAFVALGALATPAQESDPV